MQSQLMEKAVTKELIQSSVYLMEFVKHFSINTLLIELGNLSVGRLKNPLKLLLNIIVWNNGL